MFEVRKHGTGGSFGRKFSETVAVEDCVGLICAYLRSVSVVELVKPIRVTHARLGLPSHDDAPVIDAPVIDALVPRTSAPVYVSLLSSQLSSH